MVKPSKKTSGRGPWEQADEANARKSINEFVKRAAAQTRREFPRWRLRRILVGVDGTPSSTNALSWAAGLATLSGGRVWVISVVSPTHVYADFAKRAGVRPSKEAMAALDTHNGQRIVDAALDELRSAGVPSEGVVRRGSPTAEIDAAARENNVDLIIVGSHGHGVMQRITMGSVSDGVKNHATTPVLIAKAPFTKGRIVAAVDGSDESRMAAAVALRLGAAWKQVATLQHVYEVPWLGWEFQGVTEFDEIIRKYRLPRAPKNVRYVLSYGRPAREIERFARGEKAVLVTLGARGMGALRRATLGSVSNQLAHALDASVLILRHPRRG